MIEYINTRLNDWAHWVKRRADGGLGYPSTANGCKLVASRSEPVAGMIVDDSAAMEIEHIVTRLKAEQPARYQVAYWVYLAGDLTMDRVARELGCHRDTVYTRLHALHLHVMNELHEITIQAEEKRHKNIFSKNA